MWSVNMLLSLSVCESCMPSPQRWKLSVKNRSRISFRWMPLSLGNRYSEIQKVRVSDQKQLYYTTETDISYLEFLHTKWRVSGPGWSVQFIDIITILWIKFEYCYVVIRGWVILLVNYILICFGYTAIYVIYASW